MNEADKYIEFTVVRISKISLDRIKLRAIRNHRSVPKEIDFLIEIVDAVEASGMNVIKIETLPRPAGAQAVPVVYVGAEEPPSNSPHFQTQKIRGEGK